MAINAFLTGQSADSVKLAFDYASKAEQDANARVHEMKMKNERDLAIALAGGHPGVGMAVTSGSAGEMTFAPDTPPSVQAKMEWDGNYGNCRNSGATESQYLAARSRQIAGVVRTFTPGKK